MRISMIAKLAVTALALAAVAPPTGQSAGPAMADRAGHQRVVSPAPEHRGYQASQPSPSNDARHDDEIVLRRAGERAVPFEPVVGGQSALPRDRSQAVPFVAEVGPQAGPAEAGFDWGDALIGAGAACAVMVLGAGALAALRRHRPGLRPLGHREAQTRAAAH